MARPKPKREPLPATTVCLVCEQQVALVPDEYGATLAEHTRIIWAHKPPRRCLASGFRYTPDPEAYDTEDD